MNKYVDMLNFGVNMGIQELLVYAFVVYGIVLLLTQSHAFEPWRALIYQIRKWFTAYVVEECRMCQGVWVVLVLAVICGWGIIDAGAVYGISYFLATQER